MNSSKDFHRKLDQLQMTDELWEIFYEPLQERLKSIEIKYVSLLQNVTYSRYLMEYGENSLAHTPKAQILVRYKSQDLFIIGITQYLEVLRQGQRQLVSEFERPD